MHARQAVVQALLASILLAIGAPRTMAQSCRWDGTAPFCDGSCRENETEMTRAQGPPSGSPVAANAGAAFGQACATGTKAYCCATPGHTCRWSGTAPFCNGGCESNESPAQPPPGSNSGASCATGSKNYCCIKSESFGQTQQGLTVASPKYSKFAAFWEKEAGPAWQARHGLTSTQYQEEFDKLARQGYRPVEVSGYSVGEKDMYAAIWEQQPQGPPCMARHGLSAIQYQQEFDELAKEGYRLVDISGYNVGGQIRYAGIWEKRQGPALEVRHDLTSAQYQQQFDSLVRQGYRLIDISGYSDGIEDHYAAIWVKQQGPAWAARNGMTSAQYQQEFNTFSQQGYRLIRIRGWRSGDTIHYAAIWEKTAGPAWIARHGMLADAYQEEFDALAKQGYRLKHVSGY